jgi:hypothetical protein
MNEINSYNASEKIYTTMKMLFFQLVIAYDRGNTETFNMPCRMSDLCHIIILPF